ncbi:hypothetical protein V1520DRAFT_370099 [Lipomyces starkeyi]|uniref:Reverse transcriptase domain-containing protein n=1 Tax=Lipomyces starkeyi NRRL Y-11557 TaxID=675824 RepID=A0A1E3Q0Z9_LIPST|nr:hypothetical protein LIPSTDRAFT_5377 [Lipomyces starkeyi NRRL Y-11557]
MAPPLDFYRLVCFGPRLSSRISLIQASAGPRPYAPKTGFKDNIRKSRHIAILNSHARIISEAFNTRLITVLPGRCSCFPVIVLFHPAQAVLDFEKAYDRVNHQYLNTVLRQMGIPECFSEVRQDDPVSPSLFELALFSLLSLSFSSGIQREAYNRYHEEIAAQNRDLLKQPPSFDTEDTQGYGQAPGAFYARHVIKLDLMPEDVAKSFESAKQDATGN